MFELSQLRCFVAVAEELHFGQAAERLNMTQPPLSRQVQLLEHHVGAQLLQRTSRSVRLTAAGRSFLPEAMRILRLADEAASTARRVAQGSEGSLAIGFTAAAGYGLLPVILREMRGRAPGIRLTLKEMVSSAQMDALGAGQIDIGLFRPPVEHGDLDSILLVREGLVAAIPESDAADWPERLTLADFNRRRLLMYSPYEARYFYQLLTRLFDKQKVVPDVVEYVSQIHTMLALAHAGLGVALIPKAAAKLHFEGVVLRQVVTTPKCPVEMIGAFREDNDNPALALLRKDVLPAIARRFGK